MHTSYIAAIQFDHALLWAHAKAQDLVLYVFHRTGTLSLTDNPLVIVCVCATVCITVCSAAISSSFLTWLKMYVGALFPHTHTPVHGHRGCLTPYTCHVCTEVHPVVDIDDVRLCMSLYIGMNCVCVVSHTTPCCSTSEQSALCTGTCGALQWCMYWSSPCAAPMPMEGDSLKRLLCCHAQTVLPHLMD